MTHPDMRIEGRIVGVRSTEQSVGINVGWQKHPTLIHNFQDGKPDHG